MTMRGPLRASYVRRDPGLLIEAATPAGSELPGTGKPPRGLYVSTCGDGAALCRVSFGSFRDGAAQVERRFTIGPRGVWFVGAGWQTVAVHVITLGDGVAVQAAWTAERPPDTYPLQLVEAVTAGTWPIPPGASRVGLAVADGAWSWRTDAGGGPLVIPNPAAGNGEILTVQGAEYAAGVDNIACWFLEVP